MVIIVNHNNKVIFVSNTGSNMWEVKFYWNIQFDWILNMSQFVDLIGSATSEFLSMVL